MNKRKIIFLLPLLIMVMILWPSAKARAEMKDGWNCIGGKYYYYNAEYKYFYTGGVYEIGSHSYYFNQDGVMQTGWIKKSVNIEGGTVYTWWYHAADGGALDFGWKKINGKWYYFSSDGVMAAGWKRISEKWYYFSSGGVMRTGWLKLNGKYYYLKTDGEMLTGWLKVKNKDYDNLDEKTKLYYNEYDWYYFDAGGRMATGWRKVGDKWYHFHDDGIMQYGKQEVNGKYYMLDFHSGVMITGWHYVPRDPDNMGIWQGWYYCSSDGILQTGWKKLGGKWYYFAEQDQDFEEQLGYVDSNSVYPVGKMFWAGSFTINGKTYVFDTNGVCQNYDAP